MSKEAANRLAIKIRVLTHYGNGKMVCVRCGFDDMRALSIDHVNGDGYLRRKDERPDIYNYLIDAGFPGGYQTLCYNCQHIKWIAEDSPKHKAMKTKIVTTAEKVKAWIDSSDVAFTITEISNNLGLDRDEYIAMYKYLSRLCQEEYLSRLTLGRYKKHRLEER